MSDRRRSLLILLLVFGLLAASLVVIATKPTKLGLDLQGGVQLVYEGKPTPQQPTVDQQALDRALQIMRERVDAFGVAEPELQLLGARQIEVNLPGVTADYPEDFPGVEPSLVVIEKVRHGRFFDIGGEMPLFSQEALSDEDLGALLAYLEL